MNVLKRVISREHVHEPWNSIFGHWHVRIVHVTVRHRPNPFRHTLDANHGIAIHQCIPFSAKLRRRGCWLRGIHSRRLKPIAEQLVCARATWVDVQELDVDPQHSEPDIYRDSNYAPGCSKQEGLLTPGLQ
jgi:hypothetical protein